MENKSKKEKHISFLKKIGFLIRYNDLELYHGRSQFENEEWSVKNNIDNSHNKIRDNIMGIPCLCVANYNIAEAYAKGVTLDGRTGESKIHEIVSIDEDSLIINEKFNLNKLSEAEILKFNQSIQFLLKGSLSSYFKNQENIVQLLLDIKNKQNNFQLISESEKEKFCEKYDVKINNNNLNEIVGAINANIYFQNLPVFMASNYVFDLGDKREFLSSGGQKYKINQDYVRYVLDKNNIIALNKKSNSGSNDYIVYVFNLDKVQTAENVNREEKE